MSRPFPLYVLTCHDIEIMQILWATGPQTANDLSEGIGQQRPIEPFIASTMQKLCRKGLVQRTKVMRNRKSVWLYTPVVSRLDLLLNVTETLCTDLGANAVERQSLAMAIHWSGTASPAT